jgi:hypothetical protein
MPEGGKYVRRRVFGERNNMMRSVRGVLSCLAVVAPLACGGEDMDAGGMGGGGAAAKVTFTNDIHPILQMKCGTSGCHDMPNTFMPGHGSADVNVAYMEATGTGSLGIPIYTRILARISSTDPGSIMPPTYGPPPACEGALGKPGCVTQEEFDLIQEWVDQGHLK